jgi:hypothetical protein
MEAALHAVKTHTRQQTRFAPVSPKALSLDTVKGLQMMHQGRGRIALAELDRRPFQILRLQTERAQGLMLIPGRVVPGRVPVLERPPPCTIES